ncbi:hypothetical protein F888_02953 [Acinetobacter courvalinii]|uniref:Uncharacterized protein n=1 Tax=Acinetobacter courvalinii TaxID=280147 RepID=N9REP6_9GAMM|nr:hypothetical protein F888_02953 [Acinetobacter courvalinii]GGH26291.1 hypothetical protein GCM10007354_03630 [Acinetobacter courvalinii]
MQEAITSAKQIDEQSKAAGFYQKALDYVARQGYGNANFEEFYSDESKQESSEPCSEYSERVAAVSACITPNKKASFDAFLFGVIYFF